MCGKVRVPSVRLSEATAESCKAEDEDEKPGCWKCQDLGYPLRKALCRLELSQERCCVCYKEQSWQGYSGSVVDSIRSPRC